MITKLDAILAINPNAECVLADDKITWITAEIPQAEIDAEVQRLQAEYDSQEYARSRAKDYAPQADQLDMLWHAIDQGIDLKQSDFYTGNKAVKDAHPKG